MCCLVKKNSVVRPRLLFLLVVDGPDSTSRFCSTTFVQPLITSPMYGLQRSRMSLREPSACYIRDYFTPPFPSCTGAIRCVHATPIVRLYHIVP
ncbi:hypothetical protein PILCRDRAFT_564343 [Piloderma croceum F 1598]|uniref:Uncharacterized protein n=1 Tax=Piloderma croceum (strain F 1598) TaxID=765440 RepID=A0A0C3F3I4_PILCF|nr:hypothetical protein PILCRDRAFT_564343 [Piloderma croceum F 1598]